MFAGGVSSILTYRLRETRGLGHCDMQIPKSLLLVGARMSAYLAARAFIRKKKRWNSSCGALIELARNFIAPLFLHCIISVRRAQNLLVRYCLRRENVVATDAAIFR